MKMIRYTWIISLFLCSMAIGVFAEEEYRIFTDTEGRTIEGRIVEYNPIRNKLRIKRRGVKDASWVGINIFGRKDQVYIKQWIAASMFLAESNLKVSIKKTNKGDSGSKKSKKETEKIGYEVKMKNRSKQPINIAKVEYRYYVRNTKTGSREDTERSETGTLTAGMLRPSQLKVLNTEPLSLITIYTEHRESTYDFSGAITYDTSIVKVSEDKLRGIWIRIYGPKVDGQALHRDITYPKDLKEKVAWMPVSGK